MSAISTIYTKIKTILTDVYKPKKALQLKNPYEIEENNDLELKRGYGFYIGAGLDNGTMTSEIGMSRELIVTLTLETGAAQHTNIIRESAEKTLLEEQVELIKLIHTHPDIAECGAAVYQNDNGIEFIFGEKDNFIMIQTRFLITYYETGV